VVGRLDIGKYQSREGETRTSFDVWADDVQSMTSGSFRPSEPDGLMDAEPAAAEPALASANGARPNGTKTRGRAEPASSGAATGDGDLEDLPF
jgi:single-stranded DNA-binding protein